MTAPIAVNNLKPRISAAHILFAVTTNDLLNTFFAAIRACWACHFILLRVDFVVVNIDSISYAL